MKPPRPARIVRKHLPLLMSKIDRWAADCSEKLPVTCDSCTKPWCCNMMVGISLVEALLIVVPFTDDKDSWQKLMSLVPELERHSKMMETRDNSQWFHEREPCPFLDEGRCSVYDRRPIACRTHMSTEDPSHCAPDWHMASSIAYVNPMHVLMYGTEAVAELQFGVDLPAYSAPLPPAILSAIRYVTEGPSVLPELLRDFERDRWGHVNTSYDRAKILEGLAK